MRFEWQSWVCIACLGCSYGADDIRITESGADWSCLGKGSPLRTTELIDLELPVRNLPSRQLLKQVTGSVCADVSCSPPLAVAEGIDGVLHFPQMDPMFRGSIELRSPDQMSAIVDLLRPIGAMRELPELRMLSKSNLETYAYIGAMATLDVTLGHALFWVVDCAGKRAAGISLESFDKVLPNTQSYYASDIELPSITLDRTEENGGGGIINLPVGFPRFRAVRAADGAVIADFPTQIKADTTTFFLIEPE